MSEEIYDWDESIAEDNYMDAIEYFAGDVYPDLDSEEIEELIEDILDQLPEQYAERFFSTTKNAAQKIGANTLDIVKKHPDIATTNGIVIARPAGAAIGQKVGNYVSGSNQKQNLPETNKALSLIQKHKVQITLSRPALRIGYGNNSFYSKKRNAKSRSCSYRSYVG